MDFGANKTHVELIKEGAFGSTCLRYIYSNAIEKWYKKSWKVFDQLKKIDQKYYCNITIIILVSISMVLNVEHR